ncbi:hypothetical protein WG70_22530 [Burkholderia oklahomensis EO147]|nr:hypothetical protein WG70_22530 [Burkholderia oklahomensis EO147]KUY52703.1 hypothetical protein WG70_00385 [Burkholderia oklahomensis EO147]
MDIGRSQAAARSLGDASEQENSGAPVRMRTSGANKMSTVARSFGGECHFTAHALEQSIVNRTAFGFRTRCRHRARSRTRVFS